MKSFTSACRQENNDLKIGTCLSASGPEKTAEWDIVVLTASNECQSAIYRRQIGYRVENGLLPAGVRFEVVPDYNNSRIGSGGATLNVIKHLCEISNQSNCFLNKRILVIHSGGDGIRIPQYSACGKLFAPVQRELVKGITATLFDEILQSVKTLPSRSPDGMLTLAGDILLVFDPSDVDFEGCDAAAISSREYIDMGTNHGVFIPDKQGNVKRFLHKLPIEDLKKSGAQGKNGSIHIDTGAVWFSSEIINTLFDIISSGERIDPDKFEMFVNENERLSFYADFVYPMATDSTLERFIKEKPEGEYTRQLERCRETLYKALHGYKMKLIDLPKAEFIHFGTTAELLKTMTSDIEKYKVPGWSKAVNTNAGISELFTVNSSFIDKSTSIGKGSYIENSRLYNVKVGKGCIVSNITIESVEIPANTVIHCLKQKDGDYVVRVYGTDDNPKLGICEGGTFFGEPFYDFLEKNMITKDELWCKEPYDLWNAKLYLKSDTLSASLNHALNLCRGIDQMPEKIRRSSLKQSYENADFDSCLNLAEKIID